MAARARRFGLALLLCGAAAAWPRVGSLAAVGASSSPPPSPSSPPSFSFSEEDAPFPSTSSSSSPSSFPSFSPSSASSSSSSGAASSSAWRAPSMIGLLPAFGFSFHVGGMFAYWLITFGLSFVFGVAVYHHYAASYKRGSAVAAIVFGLSIAVSLSALLLIPLDLLVVSTAASVDDAVAALLDATTGNAAGPQITKPLNQQTYNGSQFQHAQLTLQSWYLRLFVTMMLLAYGVLPFLFFYIDPAPEARTGRGAPGDPRRQRSSYSDKGDAFTGCRSVSSAGNNKPHADFEISSDETLEASTRCVSAMKKTLLFALATALSFVAGLFLQPGIKHNPLPSWVLMLSSFSSSHFSSVLPSSRSSASASSTASSASAPPSSVPAWVPELLDLEHSGVAALSFSIGCLAAAATGRLAGTQDARKRPANAP
eukprot:GHVT01072461.1.p1 GENE.GHVT01072461.1~~GHVT01072461.1.p1  ORF type:complete len:426 (-),score=161.81 GHVT01072461.1:1514-2791(-)